MNVEKLKRNSPSLIYKVNNNKYSILKEVLIKEFNFSKRLILKLKQENKIYINDIPLKDLQYFVNQPLKEDDIIKVDLNFEENCDNIVPMKLDLDIVYEDDFLIVINKQPKIETHPTVLNNTKTLSNGLKYYYDTLNLKRKIRPVNRLDKDTSGLIVFAKDQYTQEDLIRQMKNKTFTKEYIAVVDGIIKEENGKIEASIARKPGSILERCIDEVNGVYAKTYYEVLERIEKNNNIKATVVKLKLDTGRTHQIRVHMKYIGHPLIGDFLYNDKKSNALELIGRQALHSRKIEFIHPIKKEKMTFEIELPQDISNMLKNLKNNL